jgi:hypothetical protein
MKTSTQPSAFNQIFTAKNAKDAKTNERHEPSNVFDPTSFATFAHVAVKFPAEF